MAIETIQVASVWGRAGALRNSSILLCVQEFPDDHVTEQANSDLFNLEETLYFCTSNKVPSNTTWNMATGHILGNLPCPGFQWGKKFFKDLC